MYRYAVQIPGASWIEIADYHGFISTIRQQFNVSEKGENLDIKVATSEESKLLVRIKTADAYISHLNAEKGGKVGNWKEIPKDLINYSEKDQILNESGIEDAIAQGRKWVLGDIKALTEGPVKILAFMLAEAARFTVVQYSVSEILVHEQEYHWKMFELLLKNWKDLCKEKCQAKEKTFGLSMQMTNIYTKQLLNGARTEEEKKWLKQMQATAETLCKQGYPMGLSAC